MGCGASKNDTSEQTEQTTILNKEQFESKASRQSTNRKKTDQFSTNADIIQKTSLTPLTTTLQPVGLEPLNAEGTSTSPFRRNVLPSISPKSNTQFQHQASTNTFDKYDKNGDELEEILLDDQHHEQQIKQFTVSNYDSEFEIKNIEPIVSDYPNMYNGWGSGTETTAKVEGAGLSHGNSTESLENMILNEYHSGSLSAFGGSGSHANRSMPGQLDQI